VAAQGLGETVHDDVGAQPERPLEERRSEGVVHHDGQARRVRLAHDLFDVDHLDRGVGRALQDDEAAARSGHLAQLQEVRGSHDPAAHAPLRQQVAHELRRASVERRAGQHLVARLRAFQRGQGLLQRAEGRVAVARVELEGEVGIAVEVPAHLSGGIEHEGGGLDDRRRERALTRPAVAVNGAGADAAARPVSGLLRGHSSTVCGRGSPAEAGVSGTAPTTGSTKRR
jgi:hypothetical protein